MLALQQNVYIPENHKLQIDIPQNIPSGENELFMVFQPKQKIEEQQENRILGLYKNKGAFKLKSDFKMSEEELLGL
jgi:hypothetical protein